MSYRAGGLKGSRGGGGGIGSRSLRGRSSGRRRMPQPFGKRRTVRDSFRRGGITRTGFRRPPTVTRR